MIHNNRTRSTLTTALDRAKLTMVAAVTALTLGVVDADADTVDIQNPNVVAGQASFNAAAHQWYITTGHRAIIEYSAFNIHNGGAVQFIQPNVSSAVLNRIISADPSSINGSLSANGGLFFVNPAGVTFGPNAVVNAGMFHAAAGKMSNSDFLNGVNRFTDLSGTITNLGSIQAGGVALLGQHVINRGTIIAPESFITLAAADRVILAPDNSGIILQIHRDSSSEDAQTGVENTGVLKARGGHVTAAAGDFYSMAMDIEGTIVAEDIRIEGGDDSIVRVAGTLNASGNSNNNNKGGYIQVTGEKVWLDNGARLNATGKRGGGEILVGGDFQGKNNDVRNAWRTHVSQDVVLNASALQRGHGGKVIVWSDDFTNYFGTIKAKGAGYKGRGGFAEVSGKLYLSFHGMAYLGGSRGGRSGLLLLDPTNLTISNGASAGVIENADTPEAGTFTVRAEGAADSNLTVGLDNINDILDPGNGNSNIIITTTNPAGGADVGNIDWQATDPLIESTNSLTLDADNDILISGVIDFNTNDYTGDFLLIAGNDIIINAAMTRTSGQGAGNIIMTAVGTILISAAVSTGGGDLTITGGIVTVNQQLTAAATILNANVGLLTFGATGDIIAIGAVELTGAGGIVTEGDITTQGATVEFNSATTQAGTVVIDTTFGAAGGANVTFHETVAGGEDLSINAGTGGAVLFENAVTVNELTITNAASVSVTGTLIADDLITTANAYTVSLTGTGNTFTQEVDFLNTDVVTLGDATADTFAFNGGMAFAGGAASNVAATIAATGDANFGTGGVTLTDAGALVTTIGGNIIFGENINGALDLTLDSGAAGTIAVAGITTVDNLVITNSGGAIFTGAVAATTDITITDTTDATTVSFLDAVTARDLVTFGEAYEVSMTGTGNTFTLGVDFLNTGDVTLGDATADTFAFDNGMAFTGGAASNVAATITAAAGDANFGDGGVTLTDAGALVTTIGGNIIFGENINGGLDLTLDSGAAGTIAVTGITTVDSLVITNSGGAIFTGAVAAITDITLTDTEDGQTVSFLDTVTANDLVTTANAYLVSMTGTGNTFAAGVDFLNTGAVTLGDATADTFDFSGGMAFTGGAASNVAATITATGDANFGTGGVTLTDAGALVTTTGNIIFGENINGGLDLTLDSGAAGTIAVTGNTTVDNLVITNSNGAIFTGAVAATTDITLTDTEDGQTVSFLDTVTANDLVTTANGYLVSMTGTGNTFTAGVDFLNTGAVTLGDATADTFDFNGGLDFTGNAASNTASTIGVTGAANFGTGGVTLTDATLVTTTGNMDFGGDIAGGLDLTLDSGAAGTIAVAGNTTVDNLVITNSNGAIFTGAVAATTDITLTDTEDGQTVSFLDTVTANDLVTTANGYLVSMTGTGNTFTAGVDFLNTGAVTLGDATADTFDFNGGLDFTGNAASNTASTIGVTGAANFGTGGVTLTDATLVTTTGNMDFGGDIAGGLDLTLDSGAAGTIAVAGNTTVDNLVITNSNGAIFTGAVAATTDITLTDTEDGQTVSFLDAVTANDLVTTANAYLVSMTGTGNTFAANVDFLNTGVVTLGDATADTFDFNGGMAFTGGAASNVAATITATGDANFGTGGVTLTDAGALVTTTGNIIFGENINGGLDLTLDSGAAGTIAVAGNTTVDNLVITNSNGAIFTGAVAATTDITLTDTEDGQTVSFLDTVTANDLVTTANGYLVSMTGTGNTFTAGVDFLNTGAVTLGDATADTFDFNGGLDFTGNAASNTASTIGVTGAANFGTGGVTLTDATLVTTTGNMDFGGDIAGGLDLTLDSGAAGTIAVAGNTTVDNLVITNSNGAIFTGAVAATTDITLTDTEDGQTVSFLDTVTANDLVTTANAYLVSMTGTGNTFAANVDFLNTGAVTLGDATADTFDFSGGMAFTGGAASNVAATITATGDANFGTGGVTLTDAGALVTTTGNIIFGENINGGLDLTLDSGAAGTIAVTGNTTVDNLVITNSNGAIFTGAVAATTDITLTDTEDGQTVSFLDTVTANDLVTTANGYLVSMTGTGNTFTAGVDFLNTGAVTLGDATADTFDFNGGLDFTGNAASNTASTIGVTGAANFGTGGVTLTDATLVTTTGNMDFGGDIAGGLDLTLDSGAAGTIAVTGNTTVDNLVITNSNGAIFTGAVAATTDITLTDTEDGQTVSFLDTVTANDLVTTANAYLVSMTGTGNTFTAGVDFLNTGAVTLGDATADTFDFNGGLDFTGNAASNTASTIGVTGAANFGTGGVTLTDATLVTTTGNMDFGGDIAGGLDLTLDSGAAGTIAVAGNTTVDNLVITNSNGAIFTGAVAATTDITLTDTEDGQTVSFLDTVTANDLVTTANGYLVSMTGTGNTFTAGVDFLNTGAVTLGDATADTFDFNGGLDFTGNAASNTASTIGVTGAANFGTGGVTLTDATLVTTTGNMDFGGDIAGGLDLTLDSGAAGTIAVAGNTTVDNLVITNSNGAIFTGAVAATTDITLTDTEDGQTVSFLDAVTANDLVTTANAYLVSMTGTGNTFTNEVDFLNTGAVTLGDAAGDTFLFTGGMAFTGNAASNVAADITSTATDVNFGTGGVTLDDSSSVTTGAGAGTITFGGTLDADNAGVENLTLTAGTGDIDFDAAVGTTRLGDVLVTSVATMTADAGFNAVNFEQTDGSVATIFTGALDVNEAVTIRDGTDVTFVSTVNAAEINQEDGSGTTTFGDVVTTDGAGVNVITSTIAVNNTVTTTTGGIVLNADGSGDGDGILTIAIGADFIADEAVALTGENGIKTGGNIVTTDDDITFNSATTLLAGIDIDTTGAAAGDILFTNPATIDGATFSLTLDAGSFGNIDLQGDLINGGAFTVRDGAVQEYQGIQATSVNVQDIQTSAEFDGIVNTSDTTGTGNAGGTITMASAGGGSITFTANSGMNSEGGTNGAGAGGVGGDIDITGTTGVTFADGITITSSGGDATGAANNGGDSGAIIIQASDGNTITIGDNVTINAEGGASALATGGDAANTPFVDPDYTIQIGTVGSTTAIVVGDDVIMSAAGGIGNGGLANGTTGTIYYGGAITLDGEADYIGDTTFGGNVTLASSSDIRVDGTLTFEGEVDGQTTFNLLLAVSDIDIQANFIDIPLFTLTGFAGTENIGLGDTFDGSFTNNIGVSTAEIVFLENGGGGISELQVGVKDFDVMNNTWELWTGDAAVATGEAIPFSVSVEQEDGSLANIYWGTWDDGEVAGAGNVDVDGDVRIDGSGGTFVIAGINTATSWSINDSIQVNFDAIIRTDGDPTLGDITIFGDHSITSFNADNNLIVEASDGNTITITDVTFDATAGSSIEDLTVQSKDSGGVVIDINNLDGSITGELVVQSDGDLITLNTTGGDFTASLGMEFRDALVLDGATDLSSDGDAGSDIFFDGSITGLQALTLNSGADGSTTFSGDVTIDALDVTGALNIDGTRTVAITNTATFNDTISGDDLTLTGNIIEFDGNVVNLNSIDVDAVVSTTIAAGIDFTTTDDITFQSALTVDGATTLETLNGTIDFQSTVGGAAADLTLNSLTGGVIFSDDVLAINSLDVNGNTTINASNVTATANIDFHGTVDVTGSTTVQSTTGDVTMDSTVTGDALGSLTVIGDGDVTIVATTSNFDGVTVTGTTGTTTIADVDVSGAITITGGTAITLTGSDYTTSDGSVTFAGDVTFADADVAVTSGGGAADNIDFSGTIDADDLTLDSGAAGTIAVGGITTVDNLVITNSNGATFTGAVAATTDITITDTTDVAVVSFLDAVTANELVTTANGYLVSMTGTGNIFTQEMNFLNTGAVTLGNETTDTFAFNGGLNFNSGVAGGAASNVAATITATGDANFGDGGVTLTDAGALVTTIGGNIIFGENINGARDLTLDSGAAGTIAVTGITTVDNLVITNSNGAIFTGAVAATTDITLTDTEDGQTVSFLDTVTANDLVTTANGYLVSMTGTGNTFAANVDFLNTGAVTLGDATADTFDFNGGLDFTGNAASNTASTIGVTGAANFGTGGVTLTDATLVTTTGNMDFGGDIAGGLDLTLDSGAAGTIAVAGNTTVDNLVITNSNGAIFTGAVAATTDITLTDTEDGQTVSFLDTVTANDLVTTANGYLVSMTGTGNTFAANVDFLNTGAVTLGDATADTFDFNGGLDFTGNAASNTASTIGVTGAANFGTGGVTLTDATLVTTTGNMDFGGDIAGGLDLTLDSGAAGTIAVAGNTTVDNLVITNSNGAIFTGAVAATTDITLTDTEDGQTVSFLDTVTANDLVTTANGYLVSMTGTGNTFAANVDFLNTGAVTLGDATADTFDFNGGLDFTGNAASNTASTIGVTGAANFGTGGVTLTDATLVTTTGNMDFGGDIAGGLDLTLDSGAAGTIAVAGNTTVDNLVITNSNGAIFTGAVAATTDITLTDTEDGQTVSFLDTVTANDLVTTANGYLVSMTGTGNTFAANVDFLNTGAVTLGDATADTFDFNGGLNFNSGVAGGAASNVAATITATGDANFGDGGVTLTDAGALVTTTGNIIFGENINGGLDLTLDSGAAGTIAVAGNTTVDNLVITNSNGAIFTGAVAATTDITLTDTEDGQTVSFLDAVTANDLVTTANAYLVSMTGTGNTFAANVDFLNTGAVTLGDATADTFDFNGGMAFTGGAASNVAATITATGDANFGTGGVTLTDAGALVTTTGNIIFGENINGGLDLTLDSGAAGTIAVAGNTTVDNLVITNSNGAIFTGAVAATTDITLTDTEDGQTVSFLDTVTANDLVTTANGYLVSMTGTGNTFTAGVDFLNTGAVTLGDATADTFDFNGGLDFTGNAASNTASTIGVTGAANFGTGGVTLTDATLVTTTGNMDFGGDIAGGLDLTLDSGAAGTIAVAGNTTVDNLVITNSNGAIFTGAVAATTDITLTDTEDGQTVSFLDTVTANDLVTTANGYLVSMTGTGNTFTAGVDFLNTGAVTLGDATADTFDFNGGLDFTGNAASNTASTIGVTGAANFGTGGVTLTDATLVTTTGNMDFGGDIAGGLDLTLDSGAAGTIAVAGNTTVDNLVITNSNGAIFTGAVAATTDITLTDTEDGQTVSFLDAVTANDLVTTANAYLVSMTGTGNTFAANVDFLNTGVVTLGDATADTFDFNGGMAFTGGAASNVAATITATGDANFGTGGVTLTDAGALVTTTGNIIFGENINGGLDLTLDSGAAGTIAVAGNTTVDNLVITNSNGAIFTGAVAATTDITLTDTEDGQTVSFLDTVTANDLVTTANGYLVSMTGTGNTFTAGVDFLNTGAVTLGDATADTFDFNGGLDFTGNAASNTASTIGVTGAANFGTGGVTLTDATLVTTTGNMDFGGDIAGGLDLTLDSGAAGTIAVAGNTTVDNLVITNSNGAIFTGAVAATTDITLTDTEDGQTVSFLDAVTANDLVTTANAYLVSMTGTGNTFAANVDFLNTGAVTLGDVAGDTFLFTGGLAFTGGAASNVAADITSTATDVNFGTGGVQINQNSSVTTGGGNITFGANVNGGGADLLLDAGAAGTISATSMLVNNLEIINSNGATFTGAVGTIGNLTITDTEDGAVVSFQDAVNVGDLVTTANGYLVSMTGTGNTFAANVDFLNTGAVTLGDATADTFDFNGGLNFTGNAPVNIFSAITTTGDDVNFGNGGVTLGGNSTIATTGGDITFGGTLEGVGVADNRTLDITAGAGDVTFTGVVGGADPENQAIGDTTITAANVTTNADFAAMSLTVNATGTTLLGGDTSALNDVTINSATITANGNVESDQGNIALAATGVLTHADGTEVNTLAGTIALTGNTINLGADVNAGGGNDISVNGATTLTSGVTVSSGANGGDVTFASTVDGGEDLVVTSGTGTVNFNGDVGTNIALNSLNVTGATTIAGVDVTADNNVDFNSNVSLTTGAVAVTSNAGDITFGGAIDGAVDLTIAATLGDTQIVGAVGAVAPLTTLTATNGGDFTADGTMTTVGDMTVDADGDLEFGGNLTAGGDITLETGSVGTIAFEAAVTDVTAVGDIVLSNAVVSATDVPAIATITSESTTGITFDAGGDFTMTAGEKLTTFGDLTITTGANGIATLGDLVTIGDIRVTADTINFISRNAGDVLNADGTTTEDQGIDVVASGQFFFSVAPGLTGGLRPVHFASNTVEADALGTLNAWIVRWTDSSITLNSIVNGTTILDLAADGIDSLNNFEVAELAGAIRPMSTMTPIIRPGHDTFKDDGEDDEETTIQEASIR